MRELLPLVAIRYMSRVAVWRLRLKTSAMPIHGRQVAIAPDCFTRVGPEGERALLRRLYRLRAKSNAVPLRLKPLADARERPDYDVPVHLRNAPTKLMKEMGYGRNIVTLMMKQTLMPSEVYFPPEIAQTRYYFPTNRGSEGKIGEKLAWLAEQDQNSPIKRYR